MNMFAKLSIVVLLSACGAAEPTPGLDTPFADANDPAYAASFDGTMDDRVSTSAGEQGGVVVLWPRVVPADDSDAPGAASAIHDSLAAAAREAAGERPVDVRPEPQRVCPQDGCRGASVGAVLLHRGGGCAVAATVSLPGEAPARIVPWAGSLDLDSTVVPFRDPPESKIHVADFVPCAELTVLLESGAPDITAAIHEVIRD